MTMGLLLLVGLPLLTARVGPVLAGALHEVQHVCACPIDSDGHCQCIPCWQLDVHGERAEGREPSEGSPVPVVTSRCGDPLSSPPLLPADHATPREPAAHPAAPPPRPVRWVARFRAPAAPDPDRLERPPSPV